MAELTLLIVLLFDHKTKGYDASCLPQKSVIGLGRSLTDFEMIHFLWFLSR